MPLYDWLSLPQTRQEIERVQVMLERSDRFVDRLDISPYAAEGLCAVIRCVKLGISVRELARRARDGEVKLPMFTGGRGGWGFFTGWRTTGLTERRIHKTIEQAGRELRRPQRFCAAPRPDDPTRRCGREIARGQRVDTIYCGSSRCAKAGAVERRTS